ncbi:uncharacterized protein L203_102835 [Cryptococcus depauperatus CBS 7841]|uniref:Glycosylphosphatidylinositol transamidase n=1 Tax=Cryptococcus depauperatus CBS 7841 TaxID=1295531 RepID=A0AAJ8JSH0_9TREE
MLSKLRRRNAGPPPDPNSINYTTEHVSLAKTISRRRRLIATFWKHVDKIQFGLIVLGLGWLIALPYEGLWKRTFVDEHALQPAQVNVYFDWGNVHKADLYLGELEKLGNSTFESRTNYLQNAFSLAGLDTGNTSTATYAHVTPPRSAGTETIIVSANWLSRDGELNLRGIATLLALGDFLRGQNHWAFDLVLIVGEGYQEGLAGFMKSYYELFSGVVWTGLNIDYPGHSFSHLGLFYEGTNGRLPNQDIINTVSQIAQSTAGVPIRYHNIPDEPGTWSTTGIQWLGNYVLGAKHLLHHLLFAASGRASGGHGLLAKYRIDALTLYCTPAQGPHGFHTLGRTVESTLRSYNNLLERLHASFFFYLLPRPHYFIPVGHYLPAAVLLGASLTIGGFKIPNPVKGLSCVTGAIVISCVSWATGLPLYPVMPMAVYLIKPKDSIVKSLKSLSLLLYGALIPTLAMVNFPQSIVLAIFSIAHLLLPGWLKMVPLMAEPTLLALLLNWKGFDLEREWLALGNLAWVGYWSILTPLWTIGTTLVFLGQK